MSVHVARDVKEFSLMHSASFSIESNNNPRLPFTERQSSGELRQILHPHATNADPPRPTGHRQHRPERICWILFHKPRVHPPIVASQRGMRRPDEEEAQTNNCIHVINELIKSL